MGKLRVFFVGVCTHLRENTSQQAEHRVVLIDARKLEPIHKHKISPHEAALRYTNPVTGKPEKLDLDGVRITVPNAGASAVAYEDSYFECNWRLTNCTKEPLSLSLDVVRDRHSVAAYFDASGRFSGGVDERGASVAILNVATNGNPKLLLESFSGKPPIEINLLDHSDVQIENVGPGALAGGSGDQDYDFLINFKIARTVPADATWPTTHASSDFGVALPFPSNTVDPGCSNSNYP